MVGEDLDLKTLIISATDKEDGDLKEKVEIVDKGGFDNNKVGTYKITYKVADSKGATATKQATVTVKEKTKSNPEPKQEQQPKPVTPTPQSEQQSQQDQQSHPQPKPQPQSTPQPKPQHKAALPRTGTTVSSLVLMGSVLVAIGVLLQVSKRKD